MILNSKLLAFLIAGILSSSVAWSMPKAKSKSGKIDQVTYAKIVEELSPKISHTAEEPLYTPAEIEKIKTEIANQRTPATGDGTAASQEFKDLADELLRISSAPRPSFDKPELLTTNTDRLEIFLAKLEHDYKDYKNTDTKLFASQFIPLRTLRGVVWKMIGLFQDRDTRPAHSLALTAFKSFAGQMNIAIPDKSWEVGFDYITQPYVRDMVTKDGSSIELSKAFADLAEFQGFMAQFREVLETSRTQLFELKVSDGGPVVLWDQKVFFGPKSLKDDLKRYKRVGELEKQLMLSNLFFTLSQLDFMLAYSLNGALDLSTKIGWTFGIDGQFIAGVEGVTAQDFHDKILKQHPEVGIGMNNRVAKVQEAFKNLKHATGTLELAWERTKESRNGGVWLLNSGYVLRDRSFVDSKFIDFARALKNRVMIKNSITGEEAMVDIPAFLNSGGPKKLADLLPTSFTPGLKGNSEWITIVLTDSNKVQHTSEFRDYRKGSPRGYDRSKFALLFPNLAKPEFNNDQELNRSLRVLNSVLGNFTAISLLGGVPQ